MTSEPKLPHYAVKALAKLPVGELLIRTSSDTDEAVEKGGGFLFTLRRNGKPFPTASAALLIGAGLLEPVGDGLIAEISQTYRRVS